jgi:hypothetical protein
MALGALILVIINLVQGDNLMAVAWTVSFAYWMLNSYIGDNAEKIKLLEAKANKYDALVEEVRVLYEANRIDREHVKFLEQKIRILEETKDD